jgi:hypothetical protein
MSKELRDRLHQVDPKLNIIPGYMHRRDWEASTGVTCVNCGREVFRSKEGLCLPCWNQKYEYQVIDNTGYADFVGMDVINQIARKPKEM